MVYNELSNGRPILYGGADGQNGHAFVFEGYNTDGLVYVNWGWDGSSDGYYNMDLVNPSDTKYSFSEGQDMIIGFCKPDVSIPRSTTLGAEADLKLSVESGKIVFDFGEDFNVYNINDYTFDGTINLIAKDQRNQKLYYGVQMKSHLSHLVVVITNRNSTLRYQLLLQMAPILYIWPL